MKNKLKFPFCSLIVLNYNGFDILEQNLNSLLALNYPKERYEILVVDNNSQDESKKILDRYAADYKNIKVYFLDQNLGFSKGNNIGIKKSKGEFVALINNDSVLSKNWLMEAIKTADKDKKIFAVNSKVLLYPKYLSVKFHISSSLSPVYAWLTKSKFYENSKSKLYYLPLWRKKNFLEIEVPYEPFLDKEIEFAIMFNSRGAKLIEEIDLSKIITFENKSIKVAKVVNIGDDVEYKIAIDVSDPQISKHSLDKIQNAGIMVFQDGYGRDIGAIVRNNQQFYEYDLGQYDKEKEVYAACGAAVVYRKKILDKIGFLDESFFMYYEDVEICERARFAGFKSVYSPKAVVRHYHALSAKEWSPFFFYHVEKGRLLHIYYNFPIGVFLNEYFKLVFESAVIFISIFFKLKSFFHSVKTKKNEYGQPKFVRRIQIIKALFYFISNSPILLLNKFKSLKLRDQEAITRNYLSILEGDWYLK